MHIVLLNQFYPPDPAPTGRYLHDLARALVARGHDMTVLASRHGYNGGGHYAPHEQIDGVEVVRTSGFAFGRANHLGKIADYAGYAGGLAIQLMRSRRPDLIVALTTPPFLGLVAASLARMTGARHAHWIMDLYPDVLDAHGVLAGAPLLALQRLGRASIAGASAAITLGPAMAERARRYAQPRTRVDWVPLWAPATLSPWPENAPIPLRAERNWPRDRLVLLYSGNFGLGHRFGEFLDAARSLGPSGPTWSFAGTGRSRPVVARFVERHPELPIELLPHVPEARLREHLCSADVHLISMDSRWEGTLLPSKLQASFAVGRPVIFVGSATQDIARWIAEADAGWVVPENDTGALITAVRAAHDTAEVQRKGRNAQAYARAHFDTSTNVRRMIEILDA
jgi:colanic acid biosynthesis glycosyl transferase WcaI